MSELTKEKVEILKHCATHMENWVTATPNPESAGVVLVSPDELESLCDMALRSLESPPSAIGDTQTLCRKCHGSGSVSTGIAEASSIQCEVCDGTGLFSAPTGDSVRVPREEFDCNFDGKWAICDKRSCEDEQRCCRRTSGPAMLAAAPVAATGAQEAVAWTSQLQLDGLKRARDLHEAGTGVMVSQPASIATIPLYAAPQPVASAPEPSARVFRWIDDAVKLLKAVRASEAGGIGCHEVEGRNWFDAQDTLLSGVPCPQEDLGFGSPADKAASARPEERDTERAWLVWSNEHRSYWGADRCGYRDDPREAGRYTLVEARSICRVRSMETMPPEAMIHEADVLRGPFMNSGLHKEKIK